MVRLKIKNNYFKVLDGYDVRESSREVRFSNLKVDFTNKTIEDLPLKYQEVQLLDLDDNYNINEIIFTGYVSNFVLPKMKNKHEFRELELELLSPLAMATVRTVDAVGTYNLQPLINELIMPLISDGFVLKEMNIGNNEVTVNYLNETVESSLNKLSNKFNFWWHIDKNKNIYINSINYLTARTPKIVYDDDNKISGLVDVIPSIDATDYCNVVNFTNLRLYTHSRIIMQDQIDPETQQTVRSYQTYNPIMNVTTINSGQEILFNFPVDISLENFLRNRGRFSTGTISDNQMFYLYCFDGEPYYQHAKMATILVENDQVVISNNISIEDNASDDNEFVLIRDTFFKNLIVGMKYNGSSNIQLYELSCNNALMWVKDKVINNDEVYKNKGIISDTGIVEKQIDMNEQWKTREEIMDIANSYIVKNTSKVEQVKLNLDEDINVDIGDTIKINKPFFLIDDIYIVTDKNVIYQNNVTVWQLTLKNTNVLENYVDLFRAAEQEQPQDREYRLITSTYNEEGIKEAYEVVEL